MVTLAFPDTTNNVWDHLPPHLWTQFAAQTVQGESDYWIYAVVLSSQTIPILGMNDPTKKVEELFSKLLDLCEKTLPGRTFLLIHVSNYNTIEYFSPINFAFTQSGRQYPVALGEVLPLDDCFEGGRLMPDITCDGIIPLPSGINLTKPCTVWYSYGHEQLGPIAPVPSRNSAPLASFTRTALSGEAPLDVSFNASASYDPDGSITSYTWDFGDSESGTGVTVSHTYNNFGTYNVQLAVSDNGGATGTVTHSITVQTPTPTPSPMPTPSEIDVVITASESEIDILNYEVEKHAGYAKLVGQAMNITTSNIRSIFIKGRFLDSSDVQLNTTSDMASDVLPNATFVFTFYIWEPENIKTIEIYEITTYTW